MKDLEKKDLEKIDIVNIKKRSYLNIISEDRLWVTELGNGFLCKLVNKNKK